MKLSWTLLVMLAGGHGVASAQAMVENAMGAGRAATMTAPAKGIGGAINNLEKTLNKSLGAAETAPAGTSRTPSRATVPAPVAPPAPVVHYEDPQQIQTGMLYDEVVKRFGPGALAITTGLNAKTLSYQSRTAVLQVEVLDGKVASIYDLTNGTIVKN